MPERQRIFGCLTVALFVLVTLLAMVTWLPVREAREEWRAGRAEEAIRIAGEWSRLRLWPRQYRQVLAASHLAAGRRAQAEPHLRALRGGTTWVSALDAGEVARRLFARGAYEDFLAYDAALHERNPSLLDRAAAQLALQRLGDADATLRTIDRGSVDAKKLDALTRALAERRSGSYAFAFDRHGKPIAKYVIARKAIDGLMPLAQMLKPYVNERVETTLDADVQRIAEAALGRRRGALVAIDPRTNEVLAIAGDAPHKTFEPGSVMKVLTLVAALANGVDIDAMFPYQCKGALEIDGRRFGDWRTHGTLPDIEEALAQSCNTVFADIGLRVGRDRLHELHRRAGFDGQTDLGLLRVTNGKTVGAMYNDFETAFYAIGLKHETATAFHLAMVASMLANRGTLTTPRILRARRSITGEVLAGPPKRSTVQVAPRAAVETAIGAMQAVVTRPLGTGRRARIDGLTLALKTGTSGTRTDGYDTVVYGFAPAEHPTIAFAVFAENAGSAEIAGAQIVKDFLAPTLPGTTGGPPAGRHGRQR